MDQFIHNTRAESGQNDLILLVKSTLFIRLRLDGLKQ